MADVKILKFNAGSQTDQKLQNLQRSLGASSTVEAFRRAIDVADYLVSATNVKKRIFLKDEHGNEQEVVIG